jgi:hypothetical protein
MNMIVTRSLIVLGAVCIIATTSLALIIGKVLYDDSLYYQQAENLMPVAYEFSYRLTDYAKTKQERQIEREEIIQLLALPEFSRLAEFPLSVSFDPSLVVTFTVNKRNIIKIGRFYPAMQNSFSPLLERPRK